MGRLEVRLRASIDQVERSGRGRQARAQLQLKEEQMAARLAQIEDQ